MKNTTKKREPKLQIKNLQRKVKVDIETLKKYTENCSLFFCSPPSEIGIILVSNQKIKDLNSRFLNKNSVTDTMSFKISRDYGEIVISVEKAKENSRVYGLNTEEEILYLIIHGYLHLKGYRDYTERERDKMFAKQDVMFEKIMKMS